jgi:hypothetical protein
MLLVEIHAHWLTDDKAYLLFDDAPAEDAAAKAVSMAAGQRGRRLLLMRGLCLALPGFTAFAPEWLRRGPPPPVKISQGPPGADRGEDEDWHVRAQNGVHGMDTLLFALLAPPLVKSFVHSASALIR